MVRRFISPVESKRQRLLTMLAWAVFGFGVVFVIWFATYLTREGGEGEPGVAVVGSPDGKGDPLAPPDESDAGMRSGNDFKPLEPSPEQAAAAFEQSQNPLAPVPDPIELEGPPEFVDESGVGIPAASPDDLAEAGGLTPEQLAEQCLQHFRDSISDDQRLVAKEDAAPVSFQLEFGEYKSPFPLMSTMVMPGESLDLRVSPKPDTEAVEVTASVENGSLEPVGEDGSAAWKWTAPDEPGMHCIRFRGGEGTQTMCLHVFVLEPYDGSEEMDGYRIGTYADVPLKGNPRYERPAGLIRVTPEMAEEWLSPHFRVRQFLCKQSGEFPKFMLAETRLLLKLEMLIEELEREGIDNSLLYITSGYRTPFYNKEIGNQTLYSRHLYGDAADIFVDADRDGKMDDIDQDGSIGNQDARKLYNIAQRVSKKSPRDFLGGLGFYPFNNWRTAFIHVDTRGYPAQW